MTPSKLVLPALGALLLIASRLGGQQSSAGFAPVTSQMLQEPDPADWLMWRRTLNSWGYSPLQQINRTNVANLKMVWSRGMGPGVQEATPLVYKGVMYLPNPSDYIQAIDAATGDLKWEYKRQVPDDLDDVPPPRRFPPECLFWREDGEERRALRYLALEEPWPQVGSRLRSAPPG